MAAFTFACSNKKKFCVSPSGRRVNTIELDLGSPQQMMERLSSIDILDPNLFHVASNGDILCGACVEFNRWMKFLELDDLLQQMGFPIYDAADCKLLLPLMYAAITNRITIHPQNLYKIPNNFFKVSEILNQQPIIKTYHD